MLTLTSRQFMAAGANRRVYRHPSDPRLCVKVSGPTTVRRDESIREVRECLRLARRGCDFHHLARFHQCVATNLGPGTVWDLILNYDGTVAKSLLEALVGRHIDTQTCRLELNRFQAWCIRFGVITHDVHPKNLVCRFLSRAQSRLVLVDGGGNNEFIPVSAWFSAARQQKIARHWQRFLKKFDDMVDNLAMPPPQEDPCANWGLHRRAA